MSFEYTEKFKTNEVSIEEFAWTCARGLPEMSSQLHEPLTAPPQVEEVVGTSFVVAYEMAQEAWRTWNRMSWEEKRQDMIEKYATYGVELEALREENEKLLEKLEAMIRQVTDWEAPEEYQLLQEFMLHQLEAAICGKVRRVRMLAPVDLHHEETFTLCVKNEAERLDKELVQAKTKLEAEEARVHRCNEWKRGLAAIFNPFHP